jgi:hypothetical protein
MSTGQAAPSPPYPPNLTELRAEVDRLGAELEKLEQTQSGEAEAGLTAQQDAQLAAGSIVGSPIIAGQFNTAEAPTTLQCSQPTITLGLLNYTPGTTATGAPIGLYTVAQGIGIVVTAYGTPPYPTTSKGVQAFSQHGEAIFAHSVNGSAVFAHTTNGTSTIVADQGSANPRSAAVAALGGSGIGVYASGQTAAVQLQRSSLAGPPTSGDHEAGELVLDANADLYLCKAGGTPGTWNQIG